jgi:hypothetical protein
MKGRRRRARSANPVSAELTDENGQSIAFATPGDPTQEERRRYALAVLRATTPPQLTPEQQAARDAALLRRMELFPHLYNN